MRKELFSYEQKRLGPNEMLCSFLHLSQVEVPNIGLFDARNEMTGGSDSVIETQASRSFKRLVVELLQRQFMRLHRGGSKEDSNPKPSNKRSICEDVFQVFQILHTKMVVRKQMDIVFPGSLPCFLTKSSKLVTRAQHPIISSDKSQV